MVIGGGAMVAINNINTSNEGTLIGYLLGFILIILILLYYLIKKLIFEVTKWQRKKNQKK